MKLIHHDNGYKAFVDYKNGRYSVWIDGLYRKDLFVFSSKNEQKVKALLPNYIAIVTKLAETRTKGWSSGFEFSNKAISLANGQTQKKIYSVKVRIDRPLTHKVWQRIASKFPTVSPEAYQTNGQQDSEQMLLGLTSSAEEVRRELLQDLLLKKENVPVEDILQKIESSSEAEKDFRLMVG